MATSDDCRVRELPTCPLINSLCLQEYPFDVYVGTSTGFLKGCKFDKQKAFNINVVDSGRAKQLEVTCIDWWSNKESALLTARRDGAVFCVDCHTGTSLRVPVHIPDGLPTIRRVKGDEKLTVAAFSNGIVNCCHFDGESDCCVTEQHPIPEPLVHIDAGNNLSCMDYSASHLLATGGKENPLKIWDITTPQQPTFSSKNVKNDWLNLRVPVWVTNVVFLPLSNKVVTSTGYSQIRLYDPSTPQRRPVIEIDLFDKNKKYPITALASRPNSDLQFLVGTTVGTLALADLRKKDIVKHYKASTGGGIVDLKCHLSSPTFVSGSIDGYLHCFDINTSKKNHSMYLHSPINCILFSPELMLSSSKSPALGEEVSQSMPAASEAEDETDDLWGQLEPVHTKKHKLKSADGSAHKKKRKVKC